MEVADPESGEIIELPEGEPLNAALAHAHLEATNQEKLWKARRAILGRLLIDNAREKKEVIGEVEVSIRDRMNANQHVEAFVDLLNGMNLEVDLLYEVLGSARGFTVGKTKEWPKALQEALERCTDYTRSAQWVETKEVRKVL